METLTPLVGILARVGIPLGLTIFIGWLLYRLDKRWLSQGEEMNASVVQARNTGCWKVNGCSVENRARCRAYQQQEIPCWQVFRRKDGRLKDSCLGCKVFREAPVPLRN